MVCICGVAYTASREPGTPWPAAGDGKEALIGGFDVWEAAPEGVAAVEPHGAQRHP